MKDGLSRSRIGAYETDVRSRRVTAHVVTNNAPLRTSECLSVHGKSFSKQSREETNAAFRAAKRRQDAQIEELKKEGKWK